MKNGRSIRRKGFTLVELLIVIVVIGILSAMMMLSSTEAVTSARANNIISNLRNLKTAAMAMYVDYFDKMDQGQQPESDLAKTHELLIKYMNRDSDSEAGASDNTKNYHIGLDLNQKGYYVYVKNVLDTRVQQKLAGRAQSVGLLDENYAKYESGKTAVYMFVTSCDATATVTADWTTETAGNTGENDGD